MITNAICVQENNVEGDTLEEKWERAASWGFDGIELRGRGSGEFAARLPELQRAARNGVPMPTVCVEMSHFVGAFDAELRRDAIAQMSEQLRVMGEIGGVGAMTPASWGMFSRRLPPFEPPRSEAEDAAVLVDGFGALAEVAEASGVKILLEPLNRYEDHMVNRLEQAVHLVKTVGSEAFRVAADTYHMNIEEADPAAALIAAGAYIGHVQASDSNRLEPGAGHIDWALFGATLQAIDYRGPIALESRLSGPAGEVLPAVPSLLRRYL